MARPGKDTIKIVLQVPGRDYQIMGALALKEGWSVADYILNAALSRSRDPREQQKVLFTTPPEVKTDLQNNVQATADEKTLTNNKEPKKK